VPDDLELTQAKALLERSRHPLLIAHPRPDGDTVGSTLALRLALLRLGQRPVVACVDPVPDTFAYLPGWETFVTEVTGPVDLAVAVDQSDLQRSGGLYPVDWRGRVPLLVIDHHRTNNAFGDVNVVDPAAAATAAVMVAVLAALGVLPTGEIATCLLTGILTDTRGLRTDTTTPALLDLVARLTRAGGDYETVAQLALDSVSYPLLRAWGYALTRLQLEDGIAWSTLTLAEKEALEIADHEDLELGNLLSRTRGARVMAAFVAMRDGTVRISLRARPGYDVSELARRLGGGGHRQAAGCTVPGPLEAAVAAVVPLLKQIT